MRARVRWASACGMGGVRVRWEVADGHAFVGWGVADGRGRRCVRRA